MELIQLQKGHIITIKPCDKGAGIIVCNFEDYVNSCYQHLNSKQKQADGSEKPFYSMVDLKYLETATKDIKAIFKEGYDKGYIDKGEFQAMDPEGCGTGRLYQLFHQAATPLPPQS